jgi:hypothetical protein
MLVPAATWGAAARKGEAWRTIPEQICKPSGGYPFGPERGSGIVVWINDPEFVLRHDDRIDDA